MVLVFAVFSGHTQSLDQESSLKAVFIYNFTRYIEWDPSADEKSDFIIGVIGQSGISTALSDIAKSKTVGNRKIIIRIYNTPEEITPCNILFIPAKLSFPLHSILNRVNRGTLTVSEEEGAAREGTEINFVIRHDKLKFESNLQAISTAGLKASSELLKLAIIVN